MSVKRFIKVSLDKLLISHRRRNEIKKFKDPRRVTISESVQLTKEQKKAIDKFYQQNYGEKIPYVWHQNFTAHSGKFDVEYFPELLYIPEFEHFMNLWPEYAKVFSDKNVLPILANTVGIKTPRTIISSTKGLLRDGNYGVISFEDAVETLKNIGVVFAKPSVDSCSGRGCVLLDFCGGVDKRSGQSVQDVLCSLGQDFVVQERIKCHESISAIYSGSVNTFRIITYIWKDEIYHMPVIMRIGSGGAYLDNAHAGGMFIALDDDGTMHKTAMTEFNVKFTEHPDTHLVYEGYRIDLLPQVIIAAKKMHTTMPQLGLINWDFTIDESGEPLLIEANLSGGSVWLPQMAHGCSPFGERTAEILRWIKRMKNKSASGRSKCSFGKVD